MRAAFLFDTCIIGRYLDARAAERWPGLVPRVSSAIAEAGGLYISAITAFEIRRGLKVLELRGQGRSKRRKAELFLRSATILETSARGGAPWRAAARMYAEAACHKPAIKLSDGDLLIAATAVAHARVLVTVDGPLHENLHKLGYGGLVRALPLA